MKVRGKKKIEAHIDTQKQTYCIEVILIFPEPEKKNKYPREWESCSQKAKIAPFCSWKARSVPSQTKTKAESGQVGGELRGASSDPSVIQRELPGHCYFSFVHCLFKKKLVWTRALRRSERRKPSSDSQPLPRSRPFPSAAPPLENIYI